MHDVGLTFLNRAIDMRHELLHQPPFSKTTPARSLVRGSRRDDDARWIRQVIRTFMIAGRQDGYFVAEFPLETEDIFAAGPVAARVVKNMVQHVENANRSPHRDGRSCRHDPL
jgi:hypothetical protein